MSGQFRTYEQMTLLDTLSATSSPESAGGRTLCALPECRTTPTCGQGAAHASRSVLPGGEKEQQTSGMSGRSSQGSSESAALQRCLESRLRAAMDVNGSPEYSLTWKRWDMPSREPICALRASARRISGNVCTGWRSPQSSDGEGGVMEIRPESAGKYKLRDEAQIAGWPTITVQDSENCAGPSQEGRNTLPLNTLVYTNVETEKRDGYRLNPRFSLWLMGYPNEWASCGERAMQSCRKSRQRS